MVQKVTNFKEFVEESKRFQGLTAQEQVQEAFSGGGRSGGGGTSTRPGITQEQLRKQQEEARLRKEADKKRIEQARVSETKRQQQIKSRTIAGQITRKNDLSPIPSGLSESKRSAVEFSRLLGTLTPQEKREAVLKRFRKKTQTTNIEVLTPVAFDSINKKISVHEVELKDFTIIRGSAGKDLEKGSFGFGVPFITSSERETGVIGFVPQSKSIGGAIEESKILSQTSPIFSPQKNIFERATNIRTQESAFLTQKDIFRAELQVTKLGDIESQFKSDQESFVGRKGVIEVKSKDQTTIQLNPEFFEQEFKGIDKQSTLKAQEFFKGFTQERITKSRGVSVATELSSLAIGLGEFAVNLGSGLGKKQIKEGESFKPFSLGLGEFEFGGEAKKIKTKFKIPTSVSFGEDPKLFIKEKAESPRLVTSIVGTAGLIFLGGSGLIKNIKKQGVIGGSIETASLFSPLRVQPKIFTAPLTSESPVSAVSFKLDIGGGTKLRAIAGQGTQDSFSVLSKQVSKNVGGKSVGVVETQIIQPATILKGGRFTEGFKVSQFEGFTGARGGSKVKAKLSDIVGVDLPGVKGGISGSLIQQKFGSFISEDFSLFEIFPKTSKFKVGKGAGASFNLEEGVSKFSFGSRKPIFKTEGSSLEVSLKKGGVEITNLDFVRNPTGGFKFKPTITGKEFNLNKLFQQDSKVSSLNVGGQQTPLSKTFGKQDGSLQKQLSNIKTSLDLTKSTTPTITKTSSPLSLLGLPRAVGGSGLTEAQISRGAGGFSQTTKTDFSIPIINVKSPQSSFQINNLNLKSSQGSFQIPKQKLGLQELSISIQQPTQSLIQPQSQKFTQLSKTLQKQKTKQITKQKTINLIDPVGFDFRGFGSGFAPPTGFAFPFIPLLGRSPTGRKRKTKRKTRVPIRPSFTGIITGFEAPASPVKFGGVDLGIVPLLQLRGTRTGLAPPRKTKKKKKVKKKKK